jgi:hypothetical protein
MDEVVFEYRLTWVEWRRIYWGATTKKTISTFVLFFAFVFGLAGLAIDDDNLAWVIVIAIFAAQYVVWTFWVAPRRYWNTAVGVQEAKRVEISDEGVLRKSESLEEKLGWEGFRSLKVAKRYFILVGRPGSGSVFLPKRGLTTTEDESTLLRVILRHIPYS